MNEKINELYNKIDNQDKIINEQALEIARLKNELEKWEIGVFSNDEELQQRIDKAIEFLHNNTMIGHCKEHYELLEILGEKE